MQPVHVVVYIHGQYRDIIYYSHMAKVSDKFQAVMITAEIASVKNSRAHIITI